MSGDPNANGHDVEAVVERMVERALEQRLGAVDVIVNQRLGPFEKYQSEVSGGITSIRSDVRELRDEVVELKGAFRELTAELKKGRLARAARKRRATQ